MGIKSNINRIFFITLWCLAGAGLLVLLGAAINYRNTRACKGYAIEITGAGFPFIAEKEIAGLLLAGGAAKGRSIQSFDLRRMESILEKNIYIRQAQLYFDNNEILRVKVTEREPVARIFTRDGGSFFIDSSGTQLPLSGSQVLKLPIFTGYPYPKVHVHGTDSLLLPQMLSLATCIRSDSFWTAQIAQVDIMADKTFELVPTVGSHLIRFGDGNNCDQKLHRLLVFYKEVLSRTGFDKYSRIDVAYAGQVIGTKKGSEGTRFDSLQGLKNIQQLIRGAQQLQPDTMRQQHVQPLERNVTTEQTLGNYDLVPEGDSSAAPAHSSEPKGASAAPGHPVGSAGPQGGKRASHPAATGAKGQGAGHPAGKPAGQSGKSRQGDHPASHVSATPGDTRTPKAVMPKPGN